MVERAFQTKGTAQVKAWKEYPSVPKDGTDTKFRSWGKAGEGHFTDLGSQQALG